MYNVPEFKYNGEIDWDGLRYGMYVDFTPVDVVVLATKENEYLDRCIASVNKYFPGSLYNLKIQIDGSKNEAENFNTVYSKSKSDYFIYLNDDVEVMDHGFFYKLLWVLKMDKVAVSMPSLIIDGFYKELYKKDEGKEYSNMYSKITETFSGGECFAIARYKIPDLRYDEELLRRANAKIGFCDTDFLLQVAKKGYISVMVQGTAIYHASLKKMDDSPKETNREFRSREIRFMKLMADKWGEDYTRNFPPGDSPKDWATEEDAYPLLEKSWYSIKSRL
jgi:hypothetical protein